MAGWKLWTENRHFFLFITQALCWLLGKRKVSSLALNFGDWKVGVCFAIRALCRKKVMENLVHDFQQGLDMVWKEATRRNDHTLPKLVHSQRTTWDLIEFSSSCKTFPGGFICHITDRQIRTLLEGRPEGGLKMQEWKKKSSLNKNWVSGWMWEKRGNYVLFSTWFCNKKENSHLFISFLNNQSNFHSW